MNDLPVAMDLNSDPRVLDAHHQGPLEIGSPPFVKIAGFL